MSKAARIIVSIIGLIAIGFGARGLAQNAVRSEVTIQKVTVSQLGRYFIEVTGTTPTETLDFALKDPSGAVVVSAQTDRAPRATALLRPNVDYSLEITMHDSTPGTLGCVMSIEQRTSARLDQN